MQKQGGKLRDLNVYLAKLDTDFVFEEYRVIATVHEATLFFRAIDTFNAQDTTWWSSLRGECVTRLF